MAKIIPRQVVTFLRGCSPRSRLLHARGRLAKVVVTLIFVLVAFAFFTPLRNMVAVYIVPKGMLEVSSAQILRMYIWEKEYKDYDRPVTCDSVQTTLSTVDWEKLAAEIDQYPAYDDQYFDLLIKQKELGVTQQDVDEIKLKHPTFISPMTTRQQKELRLLLRAFTTAMELFNVTYFLMEGSMLGVHRHHGLIPWDDDMDIAADGADWYKIKQILHCLPGFAVDTSTYMMYKFYWTKSETKTEMGDIRFPQIDLFLYTHNEDYIWALSRIKKHRFLFKKTDIFPLSQRPFEGKMAPIPKQIEDLCTSMYNPSVCVSRDYDHLRNRPLVPFYEYEYVSCDPFKKVYPFVERQEIRISGQNRKIEIRKLGRTMLSNFTIPL